MADRNRVIYQSEALYAGPSPATGHHFTIRGTGVVSEDYNRALDNNSDLSSGDISESDFDNELVNEVNQLYRIQTANYAFNINRTDVNQFGELAAIDRVALESPTVTMDFSYILANFHNEKQLGFLVDGTSSAISGIINKTEDERNYFIRTAKEGVDAIDDSTNNGETIGVGNGFLTSYTSEAAINGFPTVSINVEGLNMAFEDEVTGNLLPAVTPSDGTRTSTIEYSLPVAASNPGSGDLDISALRPGDITLSFKQRSSSDRGNLSTTAGAYNTPGVNIDNAKIQSYNLSFDLSREPLQKLGSRYAFSREISFPVNVSLSVDAIVADLTTGSLSDIINCDDSYDVDINLYDPYCIGDENKTLICQYTVKNAKLDSQSFSSDIGGNKTATLEFTAQVGGPNQSNLGLFMSGVA